jgi:hypothetical protein
VSSKKDNAEPFDYLAATRSEDYRPSIQALADAIEQKQNARLHQLAEEAAKSGVLGLMNTMNERDAAGKRKVFGVGENYGDIIPDGIEAKVQDLSSNSYAPDTLWRQSKDLARMAYRIAAIAGGDEDFNARG